MIYKFINKKTQGVCVSVSKKNKAINFATFD